MKGKRVALVTGATSGIGKEIATQLAKSGILVCINYCKSELKAIEVKRQIESFGGETLLVRADITKEEEVREMFQLISSKLGTLDILVNNAGIYILNDIENHDEANWDKLFELNLRAKFLCIKYAIPLLKRSSSPRIINIATRAAISPMEESGAYCCAAAGIVMLSKVSALELSKYNIKVNTISPGLTRTPMTEAIDTEEEFENYAKNNPSRRVGTTNDIAKTVLYLVSDDAEFINGENINVSGGILLK